MYQLSPINIKQILTGDIQSEFPRIVLRQSLLPYDRSMTKTRPKEKWGKWAERATAGSVRVSNRSALWPPEAAGPDHFREPGAFYAIGIAMGRAPGTFG